MAGASLCGGLIIIFIHFTNNTTSVPIPTLPYLVVLLYLLLHRMASGNMASESRAAPRCRHFWKWHAFANLLSISSIAISFDNFRPRISLVTGAATKAWWMHIIYTHFLESWVAKWNIIIYTASAAWLPILEYFCISSDISKDLLYNQAFIWRYDIWLVLPQWDASCIISFFKWQRYNKASRWGGGHQDAK